MAVPISIPRLGFAMTEGTIVEWVVDDGATVEAGDHIYTLESDKVETEIEAPASGILHQVGVAGETYEVGAHIGDIE